MPPDLKPHIHLNEERWSRHGDVWVCGWAYEPSGPVLGGTDLAQHIAGSETPFTELIPELGGNFAAISQTDSTLFLAVDRIRSIPLFYGRKRSDAFVVSDDARFVARKLESPRIDPAGAIELMLQSSVTGSETLVPGLKQVRAGEIICIRHGEATATRFFRYGDGSLLHEPEAVLLEQAAQTLCDALDRFIESIADRPVAVPLSGGLDSRLIAARLAAAGRTDAVCFTYGPSGAQEARISKRVAAHLGLPWHRIPYSASKWMEWAGSTSFQRFQREATGLAAIEHEQDWPAVLELKNQSLAPPGTVFVPGHAGDFLGGSHLPSTPDPLEANAAEWILTKYYTEWPRQLLPALQLSELKERIHVQIGETENPLGAFACFGWQERQAKLISNSVRVYEHHGFGWRLPFWSHPPALEFWGRVPLAYRRESYLYRRAVRKVIGAELFDIPTSQHPRTRLSARTLRLFDGGMGRYAIWAGRHPILAATRTRIRDIARIADTNIADAIEPLLRPVASLPVQRVSINALLALGQLNRLTNEPL